MITGPEPAIRLPPDYRPDNGEAVMRNAMLMPRSRRRVTDRLQSFDESYN